MPLLQRLALTAAAAGTGAAAGTLWAAARSRPEREELDVPEPPAGLPPGRLVAVPGHGEMFVRETGPEDGPVVVLLHGWMYPSDLNWWTCYEPVAAVARVIATDCRGHGRGTRPSAPFRLHDVADDVAALLRHLDAAPAVAVGYSMGGAVAQLLWQRNPDTVRGLVLCATSASWTGSPQRIRGLQVLLRLAPRRWWEDLYVAQVNGETWVPISQMVTPDTAPALEGRLPWVVAELDRGSAEDVAEAGRELARFDARGWLGTVDVPAAVVVTTRDRLVPPALQHDLADRIPGASVFPVPLDHDGVIARPDLFVPALTAALDAVLLSAPSGSR
jgi:3-oxoadipate enol-lactonase